MPLADAIAAFTVFNEFLLTPPGQKLATDAEGEVTTLMSHFGAHLAPPPAAPPAPSTEAVAHPVTVLKSLPSPAPEPNPPAPAAAD